MDTNLQKYRAFIGAVECGSFTSAAQRLHYSQSGISRMIGDLEREWGMALLQRGHAGVQLTAQGARLLPYAREVCRAHQQLQDQIEEINGLQTGLIRIGTFSSVATHWLPGIISRFQQDYPAIDYELLLGDYTEIEGWIAEGRVDCGFLRLPTRPEFETVPLQRDELLAVLPEDHPLAGCDCFPMRALCDSPFMLLEKGGRAEIAGIFERCHLTPNIHFTTWDDYAIMSMVESGLGISILPRLILQRVPYHIAIKRLQVPAYREIGLALRSRKTAPLAVRRFLEYLQYRPDIR